MTETCAAPYCDRPAIAAVHNRGTSILIRPDHLIPMWAADFRCLECTINTVEDVTDRARRARQ